MKIQRIKDIETKGYRVAPYLGIRNEEILDSKELSKLLDESKEGTVNIRTYKDNQLEGNPFIYGLGNVGDVEREAHVLREEGYHLIINETIDVNDGEYLE